MNYLILGMASSFTAISVTFLSVGKRANAETRRTFHSNYD